MIILMYQIRRIKNDESYLIYFQFLYTHVMYVVYILKINNGIVHFLNLNFFLFKIAFSII